MAFSGNMQNNNEVQNLNSLQQKSNLSETALIVKGMMDKYIMPLLESEKLGEEEKENLITQANRIFREKLAPDSPEVVNFAIKCRDLQAKLYQLAQADGCDSKQLAVVNNYFSRLVGSMQTSPEVQKAPIAATVQMNT